MSKKTNKFDDLSAKRIEMGNRIRVARDAKGISQGKLADLMSYRIDEGVTNQAISQWELGCCSPSTQNLVILAEILGVSVSSLVENEYKFNFKTQQIFYDWTHMEDYVKKVAKALKWQNTLKALPYAKDAHDGQKLKNSDIPYISHPLNMACHMLAMDIKDDAIIAATLLHDVIEDCGKKANDLPVNDEVKELVVLMTHDKVDESQRPTMLKKYYKGLSSNPKAALIKLVDRCNNLTKMSWGLSKERIYRMGNETVTYVLPLLNVIKNTEYDNAKWLLSYQIQSILDIYRRLM